MENGHVESLLSELEARKRAAIDSEDFEA
eukprot:SAG11_NODE_14338_length_616_cov_0.798839_1_plen_28_part_01